MTTPAFLKYLYELSSKEKPGNKAILAHLKRSLSTQENDFMMYKYLGRYIQEDMKNYEVANIFLIAGLFAIHQNNTNEEYYNIAKSVLLYKAQKGKDESIDKRFETFLNSDRDELPDRLRQLVKLLIDVPINFDILYSDITWWNEKTKNQLAKDYWSSSSNKGDDNE